MHNIGVSGGLLTRFLFFIGVAEDDHLAVAGRSEEVTVEVAEQPFGELRVPSGVSKKTSSSKDEESSITGMFLEGPPCSNTGERGWHEVTSDGDPGGGGNPDGAGDGVLASLGDGLPLVEGERGTKEIFIASFVLHC
jgi:hypothetical protein